MDEAVEDGSVAQAVTAAAPPSRSFGAAALGSLRLAALRRSRLKNTKVSFESSITRSHGFTLEFEDM